MKNVNFYKKIRIFFVLLFAVICIRRDIVHATTTSSDTSTSHSNDRVEDNIDDMDDINKSFREFLQENEKEINKAVKELFPEIGDDFSILKKDDRKLLFDKIGQKSYDFLWQVKESFNILYNSLVANVKNIERNYIIINDNIINYIDTIKANKYGYSVRILNFYMAYPYNSIINPIIKLIIESEKKNGVTIGDIGRIITNQKNVYDLGGLYINADLLTVKYEKNINNNLSFGFLTNFNLNQNLLISGINLNFNYSLGTWLNYHSDKLRIDTDQFSIDNKFTLGLFFTQKFLEKKIAEFFSNDSLEEKNENKSNFYDTHNATIFAKINFSFDMKDNNYFKYLVDKIELNNTTRFSYYYFRINDIYFPDNKSTKFIENLKLNFFGSYHYFCLENNKRITFSKRFDIGRHFFIAIPYGIDIRYDLLNFGRKILADIPNSLEIDNLYNKRSILEFFAGLDIGIFGKTIQVEFSNSRIRLNFVSKF